MPFASTEVSARKSPTLSVAAEAAQPLSDNFDSTNRCMSDGEREIRIGQHGSLMLHFFGEWNTLGRAEDRALAERHLLLMGDLIKGRSPEQILKMERERGLL